MHQKIGFIGMGLMGSVMASRLCRAGYIVHIWNRDPVKCAPIVALGAKHSDTLNELLAASDIVMLCLSDTLAVQTVVFGSGRFTMQHCANKTLIDFSSIAPSSTVEFSRRLKAEADMNWIDCPVSGGVAGAESGELCAMVGGVSEAIDDVRPILAHLTQRVTHMGPIGCGQATKVCNQMIVSANILVMAEVIGFAKKAGIDTTKIPTALAGGFADSIPLQLTGQRMANGEFEDIKWHVKTLLKDLSMSDQMGRALNANTPMSTLAHQLMKHYCEDGYADMDPSALIQEYLD